MNGRIRERLLFGAVAAFLVFLTACQTKNVSEIQRFETSVRKELPFRVDSLRWFDGVEVTYQFANQNYITVLPDAEIGMNGELSAYRRVTCIDRYLKDGRTLGYVYVLQSESEQFPTLGKYHWDVSDLHNVELLGKTLEHLRELTLKRIKGKGNRYIAPTSQDDYWTLMFHADSLFADGLYPEAKQMYDLAFTEDRYILPSQLSTVAHKMMAINNDEAAQAYLNHRIRMEKDFYEEPSACSFLQLKDTFGIRKQTWNYNLPLKEKLEWIIERDQYDRMLWSLTANMHPEQTSRNNMLGARVWDTDSTNLIMVNEILSEGGFPRKSEVGEFALLAVWSVFQHNPLEQQKEFLPQLEEAVRNGDVAPMYLAMLKDRIDIREGRPQKYGTQRGPEGLCPLLDASRVNEWRKEVGLPPIEIK